MVSLPNRAEPADPADPGIRTEAQIRCVGCGSIGQPRYENLRDRFFGAPGRWNLSRCLGAQCGMLWLDPMPLADDLWKAYRDYYTHEEAVARILSPRERVVRPILQSIKRAYVAARLGYTDRRVTARERMLAMLAGLAPTRRADTDFPLKYLPYAARGRMLDVGCGSGELLVRMRALGWRAEGIDNDPAAVAVARGRALKVHAGSLRERNFPAAAFDAVVMSHVIEHVHQPRELLAEVRRIVKPGGRVVIATPNAASLGHRMMRAAWPFLDPPRHLQIFTPPALEATVRAAGFDNVRLCTEIRTAAAMLPRPKSGGWPKVCAWRVASRVVEYGENLALHFDAHLGEEIALVAVR
jgi:2-polyprenyl-3-methyl-5-hydroxy-6-metoxy-1,4-benzoquinol methylase